jgi:hypothetical protein
MVIGHFRMLHMTMDMQNVRLYSNFTSIAAMHPKKNLASKHGNDSGCTKGRSPCFQKLLQAIVAMVGVNKP